MAQSLFPEIWQDTADSILEQLSDGSIDLVQMSASEPEVFEATVLQILNFISENAALYFPKGDQITNFMASVIDAFGVFDCVVAKERTRRAIAAVVSSPGFESFASKFLLDPNNGPDMRHKFACLLYVYTGNEKYRNEASDILESLEDDEPSVLYAYLTGQESAIPRLRVASQAVFKKFWGDDGQEEVISVASNLFISFMANKIGWLAFAQEALNIPSDAIITVYDDSAFPIAWQILVSPFENSDKVEMLSEVNVGRNVSMKEFVSDRVDRDAVSGDKNVTENLYQLGYRVRGLRFDDSMRNLMTPRQFSTYAFDNCRDFSGFSDRDIMMFLSDWLGRESESGYADFYETIVSTSPRARDEIARHVDRDGLSYLMSKAGSNEKEGLLGRYWESTGDAYANAEDLEWLPKEGLERLLKQNNNPEAEKALLEAVRINNSRGEFIDGFIKNLVEERGLRWGEYQFTLAEIIQQTADGRDANTVLAELATCNSLKSGDVTLTADFINFLLTECDTGGKLAIADAVTSDGAYLSDKYLRNALGEVLKKRLSREELIGETITAVGEGMAKLDDDSWFADKRSALEKAKTGIVKFFSGGDTYRDNLRDAEAGNEELRTMSEAQKTAARKLSEKLAFLKRAFDALNRFLPDEGWSLEQSGIPELESRIARYIAAAETSKPVEFRSIT